MDVITGTVVVAQESRFRLVDESGRAHLFLLAHNAPLEPEDLIDLQSSHARVRVRYSEAQDLVARIAHDLTVIPPPPLFVRRSGASR